MLRRASSHPRMGGKQDALLSGQAGDCGRIPRGGLAVPELVHLLNDFAVEEFIKRGSHAVGIETPFHGSRESTA